MSFKSYIKLFGSLFANTQASEQLVDVDVEGVFTAFSDHGYLQVNKLNTGILPGCYVLNNLETVANLIGDDKAESTATHVKFNKVKLAFAPVVGKEKYDYSFWENDEKPQKETVEISDLLHDLLTALDFLDIKSQVSTAMFYANSLYAHNSCILLKKTTNCSLNFEISPFSLYTIYQFLCLERSNHVDVDIVVTSKSIKLSTPSAVLCLSVKPGVEVSASTIQSLFNNADKYEDGDIQMDHIRQGTEALKLVQDNGHKVLVLDSINDESYNIRSVCHLVTIEDLEKPNKFFKFAARLAYLNICIKILSESLEIKKYIVEGQSQASMILFKDFKNDLQIIISCVLTQN
jgi:hypothetical protein